MDHATLDTRHCNQLMRRAGMDAIKRPKIILQPGRNGDGQRERQRERVQHDGCHQLGKEAAVAPPADWFSSTNTSSPSARWQSISISRLEISASRVAALLGTSPEWRTIRQCRRCAARRRPCTLPLQPPPSDGGASVSVSLPGLN